MMNNANEITHHTHLYGFIGEQAGQSSISATLNKLFKANNKDAMMIPMNIRDDDFYFTIVNMKKSHVNGALISKEYTQRSVEALDESSEYVKSSGMCDIVYREGQKLIGDIVTISALREHLKTRAVKKVALLGVDCYAKAFVALCNSTFDISFFSDNLEQLMDFVTKIGVKDADINRMAEGMNIDMSRFDAVVDFSDFAKLDMISKLSKINMDLKPKKEFSPLKVRANELESLYIGFDDMLEELSSAVYSFFESKGHLLHDKSDMRF
ncbi:MAG: hypothetical protein QG559_1091 [Campylobacterota bacterium]|nr:hypothetical protein [Campylobacterota bacterium]